MATVLAVTSYPHIVQTPGVRGGKACIDGTRIAVVDVVVAYEEGHSPEAIRTLFSSRPLTLAEVAAALAYADDNRGEIEAIFAEEEGWDARHEQWKAEYLAQHRPAG